MSVPARAYLSIGEVLGRLRNDFPDITISKIRFLVFFRFNLLITTQMGQAVYLLMKKEHVY